MPKTTNKPEKLKLPQALRKVAAEMEREFNLGERSAMPSLWTILEAMDRVADKLEGKKSNHRKG